jgi:Fe-S-cluster containining protein
MILDKGDTPLIFPQFENEEKMTESEICVKCSGCCRYVSVEIDKPKTKEQIDTYVYYILHRNVQIYIDNDKKWNILFITPCSELLPDGRCNIYLTRPQICRDYSATACSRTGKDHTHLFKTPDTFLEYLEQEKSKKKKKVKKK